MGVAISYLKKIWALMSFCGGKEGACRLIV